MSTSKEFDAFLFTVKFLALNPKFKELIDIDNSAIADYFYRKEIEKVEEDIASLDGKLSIINIEQLKKEYDTDTLKSMIEVKGLFSPRSTEVVGKFLGFEDEKKTKKNKL